MRLKKVIHILTKKEKKNQKKKETITIINQLFSGRDRDITRHSSLKY